MLGRALVLHKGLEGNVEQSGADAEAHQKCASGEVAKGVTFARGDQFALDGVEQVRKQGQSTRAQREDAELDLAARPEAGKHAADADADDQCGQ